MEGQAPVSVAPPYYSCKNPIVYQEGLGIRFAFCLYVQTDGQTVQQEDKLYIKDARNVFVYLSGLTDFEQKDFYIIPQKQNAGTFEILSV